MGFKERAERRKRACVCVCVMFDCVVSNGSFCLQCGVQRRIHRVKIIREIKKLEQLQTESVPTEGKLSCSVLCVSVSLNLSVMVLFSPSHISPICG